MAATSVSSSWAQIAKGHSLPQPIAPQSVSSQSASVTSSQSRDATNPSTSGAMSIASNDVDAPEMALSNYSQPDTISKPSTEPIIEATKSEPSPSSPAAAEASPAQTQDSKKQSMESLVQNTERRSKTPNSSARASDASDVRKSRKGKKPKGAEKDTEQDIVSEKDKESNSGKAELRDSSPPSYNIWQARAAEAAERKAATAPRPPTNANNTSNVAETGSRSATKDQGEGTAPHARQSSHGAKPQKNGNDAAGNDPASRRPAARGSRINDKESRNTKFIPSVTDVNSWPTPDSAANEPQPVEKPAKQEAKDETNEVTKQEPGSKKKNWLPINIVPKYTSIPQKMGATGRGGREGARGGRETGTRGNTRASGSADRTHATSTKNPSGEGIQGGRATSVPQHAAQQGSVDISATRETRPESVAQLSGQPSVSSAPARGVARDLNTNSHAQQANARSGSHKQNQVEAGATGPGQNYSLPEGSNRQGQRANSGPRSGETSQDTSGQGGKEANQSSTRGEMGRPRGGHRGRGGHGNGQGHQSHPSYASNSQFPVGGNNGPSRQGSYPPFNGPYTQYNNVNGRRHSNAYPRSSQPGSRNVSRPPPLHTGSVPYDPNMYPPTGMPVQMAPYFGNSTNDDNMTELTRAQIEYYFCIDNLVKDTFMRQNMDSQGFVPLDFIANFKRMKQLNPTRDLLRSICQHSATIEFVMDGHNNRELLRRREDWQRWVLPAERRLSWPDVDHGPESVFPLNIATSQHTTMMPPQYFWGPPPIFSPNGTTHHYGPMSGSYGPPMSNGVNPMVKGVDMNGVNGHHAPGESQLSAAVPAFEPSTQPVVAGPSTNVHPDTGMGTDAAAQLNGMNSAQVNGFYEHEQPLVSQAASQQPPTNGVNGHHADES